MVDKKSDPKSDPKSGRKNATGGENVTFQVSIGEAGLSMGSVVHIPQISRGLAICAHASAGDRFIPRNKFVAEQLNAAGYATIAVDLFTSDEAGDRINIFNIELLASRVTLVAKWAASHARLRGLPVALIGSNTAAAAVLKAATHLGDQVQAIISRGGRPDLASDILEDVLAPTLLIVGRDDTPVVSMNEWVLPRLRTVHNMSVIEGSDHLFEEDGALQKVADLSIAWLERFLNSLTRPSSSWKSTYMTVDQAYII